MKPYQNYQLLPKNNRNFDTSCGFLFFYVIIKKGGDEMSKILGSWSGMRKYLEEEMLAESLQGRVRYGCTAYVGMDGCRIFEICIDGKQIKRFSWETVNSYFIDNGYNDKYKICYNEYIIKLDGRSYRLDFSGDVLTGPTRHDSLLKYSNRRECDATFYFSQDANMNYMYCESLENVNN
jgi:hypothetical protein